MKKKVTLSEAIAIAKQKENEVFKLTQLRRSILNQSFDEKKYLGQKEEFSAEDYNKKEKEFLNKKKEKIAEVEIKIEAEIKKAISIRNEINKLNVKTGQDLNLINMKWLRIQLDNLMKDLGGSRRRSYFDSDMTLDSEMYEDLGLGLKLRELEKEKTELDARVQKINHTTDLEIEV